MNELDARLTRVSKYLAKHLRHTPEAIGIELEDGGWVRVDKFLRAATRHGFSISRSELDTVVAEPTKRRYAYNDTATKIRAVQGHSTAVDLGYLPAAPPATLYHGTHPRALDQVFDEGLNPMSRLHVHLSEDAETARAVGARRGKPVILRVAAAAMHADGHVFYRADNGVWLTVHVPPRHLATCW